ncbi:MAG TPA: hypothetical protein VF733_04870 [Candidatus Saccharimonadales bacterium]
MFGHRIRLKVIAICLLGVVFSATAGVVRAASPVENPQAGSIGLEGRIPSKPPTQAPTISTPTNGQGFTKTPITVAGLCPKGLLIKVFANNVFVGSVMCDSGSYTILVDLFAGQNDLIARAYDTFDQAGPDSNIVKVTFNDTQFSPFGGSLLSLTSSYAQRGSNPGETLTWPVILSGGTGPYAISVDWGDNKAPDLISRQFAGTIDLKHVYSSAGVYRVIVKATDKNGLTAYLQLVAVANGAIVTNVPTEESEKKQQVVTRVLWAPAAASVALIFVAFWLGRRYELAALRKRLEG